MRMRATMLVLSLRATSGLSRTPAHFRFTTLQCDSDQGLCGDVTIRLELPNWVRTSSRFPKTHSNS